MTPVSFLQLNVYYYVCTYVVDKQFYNALRVYIGIHPLKMTDRNTYLLQTLYINNVMLQWQDPTIGCKILFTCIKTTTYTTRFESMKYALISSGFYIKSIGHLCMFIYEILTFHTLHVFPYKFHYKFMEKTRA